MNRLNELRKESNYTQEEVAKKLEIKRTTYSTYENKTRQLPIEILIKLTEIYDTSTDYILYLTNIKTPYKNILGVVITTEELTKLSKIKKDQ